MVDGWLKKNEDFLDGIIRQGPGLTGRINRISGMGKEGMFGVNIYLFLYFVGNRMKQLSKQELSIMSLE